jgi:large conductance mechanosensitive channel
MITYQNYLVFIQTMRFLLFSLIVGHQFRGKGILTKMGFVQEFKEFAMKGNVVDLAVGVIIGGAFGKIVASLVADVIMPPIGWLIGGVSFTDLKLVLPASPLNPSAAAVTVNIGAFLQVTFDFLIVAFVIFSIIKALNHMKKEAPVVEAAPEGPPAPSRQEVLLEEIRNLLANKG